MTPDERRELEKLAEEWEAWQSDMLGPEANSAWAAAAEELRATLDRLMEAVVGDDMSDRKQVWTVEAGDYSDYHVVGVYSTRENAVQICEALSGADRWYDYEVVERTLNPGIEAVNEGLVRYPMSKHVEPHSDSAEYAFRRLRDAWAAFWWEVVYATRLDRLAVRIEALLAPEEADKPR